MTVEELIKALQAFPGDARVMVRDSIGPQDIGSPFLSKVTKEDADNCGDAEGLVGQKVVAIRV